MPKKHTSLAVNLLPHKEPSFGDKFLNWSLTFGRYIIIGTEIVVLLAFFSRFKLDRDYSDLNEQVKEKQKILTSLKPTEDTVNRLQLRLSEIERVEATAGGGINALPAIASFTPPEITYQQISVAGNKVTIIGAAQATEDISRFVGTLANSSLFKKDSVSLEKVERRKEEDKVIIFTISALVEAKK